ncbi:hypothetical protein BC835DRAFT_1414100 [Cytidiella melzeri]|nr:hypothetical protein BC835DRAFT_1414100 [Cytidiella melzeri]
MDTSNVPFNVTNPSNPNLLRAPSTWPVFYQASAILGWAGLIRIDNETIKWLGDPSMPAGLNRSVLENIQLTPTRTIMNLTAGPIDLQVTWLSPIEPSDLAAQSLPLSYLSLQARANDGQSHTVQVYSDISAEWSAGLGERGQLVNWNVITTDQVVFHEQSLVTPQSFSEAGEQALDATTYYGMQQGANVTYMADKDSNCRGQFASFGNLTNNEAQGPSPINNPFFVYAVAKDLGTVGADFTAPVVWAVGMLRDPAVAYTTPEGLVENRDPVWKSVHDTPQDAMTSFLLDGDAAFNRSAQLDTAILQKAASISTNYADLVSLAARQAMAGVEVTMSPGNSSDVKMFMKDIGSTSANSRVSPVEVLYASFSSFLYMNVSYGGYLLEPLLEFSNSSRWTFNYAPSDLGLNYPNATGNTAAHNEEVEQTGNMLIMTLAHAKVSGDGSLISRYYDLLKEWGNYLVANSLPVPSNQQNADQLSKPNSTNLAIKGIIGIQAMAEISQILSHQADSQNFSNTATAYVNTWRSLAISTDSTSAQHILSNYGSQSTSFSLAYNLYADKWLGTNIVPASVYSNEETFLKTLIANNPNGLPIQNDPSTSQTQSGNTAWTLFTAATVSDSSLRDSLITPIWNHVSQNKSTTIFPTNFKLDSTGNAVGNTASPGVGGIFAPLALTIPSVSISVPAISSPAKKKSNAGAIAGGVIAAVVGMGLIVFLSIFFWRRSHANNDDTREKASIQPGDTRPEAFPYEFTPYEPSQVSQPATVPRLSIEPPFVPLRGPLPDVPARSIPPEKGRQAPFPTTPRRTPPTSSSGYTSASQPASSAEPPSTAPPSTAPLSTAPSSTAPSSSRSPTSSTSPISPQEVLGLRIEVENLRRVMQTFQPDRFDPPPEYEGE